MDKKTRLLKELFVSNPYASYETLLPIYNQIVESDVISVLDKQRIILDIPRLKTGARFYSKFINEYLNDERLSTFSYINLINAKTRLNEVLNFINNNQDSTVRNEWTTNNYYGVLDALKKINAIIYKRFSSYKIQTSEIDEMCNLKPTEVLQILNRYNDNPEAQELIFKRVHQYLWSYLEDFSKKLTIYACLITDQNCSFNFGGFDEDIRDITITNNLSKQDLMTWASQIKGITKAQLDSCCLQLGKLNNPEFETVIKEELQRNFVLNFGNKHYWPKTYAELNDIPVNSTHLPEFLHVNFFKINNKYDFKEDFTPVTSMAKYLFALADVIGDYVYVVDGCTISKNGIFEILKSVEFDIKSVDNIKSDKYKNHLPVIMKILNMRIGTLSNEEVYRLLDSECLYKLNLAQFGFIKKLLLCDNLIDDDLFDISTSAGVKAVFKAFGNSSIVSFIKNPKNWEVVDFISEKLKVKCPEMYKLIHDSMQFKDELLPDVPVNTFYPATLNPEKDTGCVVLLRDSFIFTKACYAEKLMLIYLASIDDD